MGLWVAVCWSLAWQLPLRPPLYRGFLLLYCYQRWAGPLVLSEHTQPPRQTVNQLVTQAESYISSLKKWLHKFYFCRSQPLSLSDLQRVLQNSGVHEGLVFSGAVGNLEDGNALRLIPTAVRLLTERASHGDWIMRSSWLSHLGKSHKYAPGLLQCKQTTLHTTTQTFRLQQKCFILPNKLMSKSLIKLFCKSMAGLFSTSDPLITWRFTLADAALVQVEAGNRALKAVFGSKLAAKGKSLAELLQPHSTGKQFSCSSVKEK